MRRAARPGAPPLRRLLPSCVPENSSSSPSSLSPWQKLPESQRANRAAHTLHGLKTSFAPSFRRACRRSLSNARQGRPAQARTHRKSWPGEPCLQRRAERAHHARIRGRGEKLGKPAEQLAATAALKTCSHLALYDVPRSKSARLHALFSLSHTHTLLAFLYAFSSLLSTPFHVFRGAGELTGRTGGGCESMKGWSNCRCTYTAPDRNHLSHSRAGLPVYGPRTRGAPCSLGSLSAFLRCALRSPAAA